MTSTTGSKHVSTETIFMESSLLLGYKETRALW